MIRSRYGLRPASSDLSFILAIGSFLALFLIAGHVEANVSLKETIKFMYDSGYGATAVASSLSAGLIASREDSREVGDAVVRSIWDATEKDFASVVGGGVNMAMVRDKDGSTVLIQLVKFMGKEKGDAERQRLHAMLIGQVIKRGMDFNARNIQGKTALAYAREYGLADIVRLLQQAGARE